MTPAGLVQNNVEDSIMIKCGDNRNDNGGIGGVQRVSGGKRMFDAAGDRQFAGGEQHE